MNLTQSIHKSWFPVVLAEFNKEPLTMLKNKILPNISFQPLKEDIFNVFSMSVNDVKVVILGQDYYSSLFIEGVRNIPLQNIYQELNNEGIKPRGVEGWPFQGVFLLHTALTVEDGKAGSHTEYWKDFSKRIISYLSEKNPCIWILWGKKAIDFMPNIKNFIHVQDYDRDTIQDIPISDYYNYVFTAPHPGMETFSEGKAGFYGCDHFYMVNTILQNKSFKPIIW